MRYVVIVTARIAEYHVYEVDAISVESARAKSKEKFTRLPAGRLGKNADEFKHVRDLGKDGPDYDFDVYTIDPMGACDECKDRSILDHTIENFDCPCECHEEEEDLYEVMFNEACDKDN